jgi:dihydroxy-acid dehydratase
MGGPLAVVEDGDLIKIDIPNRSLNVDLSDEVIQERLDKWEPPEIKVTSKTLLKYRELVTSASKGAVLKF